MQQTYGALELGKGDPTGESDNGHGIHLRPDHFPHLLKWPPIESRSTIDALDDVVNDHTQLSASRKKKGLSLTSQALDCLGSGGRI